jgi:hypothetical protein
MKSHFNPKRIEFVRQYVEKHFDARAYVVLELCDETEKIWEENVFLRENIFTIEQAVEPEKRWENILAAKLARAVEGDILEITNSIDGTTWIINIQKKFGKTPQQRWQDEEERRQKAERKAENLLKENKQMQYKLVKNDIQLQALTSIKNKLNNWNKTPEEELKTRQEIDQAIELVNGYVTQFNNSFYRKEIGKLTVSMQDAYREAWMRASGASSKINILEREKKELFKKLNDKRIINSKFSKYRKKI